MATAEARESDGDLSDLSENSEPVEPGLDLYDSDSSLDEAEEKLRSVDAKFISIRPYRFEPAAREKFVDNHADAASETAHAESAEKTAVESVSAAPRKDHIDW